MHANRVVGAGRNFDLFARLHVQIYGDGIPAIIQRKRISLARLQRQGADMVDGRHYVSHTGRNVVLLVPRFVLLDVLLVEHGLPVLIVESDVGIDMARALLGPLADSVRTKSSGIEKGLKHIMHRIEHGHGTCGVRRTDNTGFLAGAINAQSRRTCVEDSPLSAVDKSLSKRDFEPWIRRGQGGE